MKVTDYDTDYDRMRILFFGTHPKQFNGYSKVVYELSKEMSRVPDVTFLLFGFQNFHNVPGHRTDFPENVAVYDAFANENPQQAGFGVGQVRQHVALARPDIVVVYNDLVVITSILEELRQVPNRSFKIVTYIDQVYLCQKKEHIAFVNQHADAAIMFTEFWSTCISEQGLTLPSYVMPHAFNPRTHYPAPKALARRFFGLPQDDFIILNLNRNQPRKRWDTCLKAFAEVLRRCEEAKITPPRLVIATEMTGGWNLDFILERELARRGLNVPAGMARVSRVDAPQRMTDEDTNILYNVADIGINTCDGEGFGLCNFEQAAIGVPQVVPRLGGFLTFFDDSCAYLVEPKLAYYVDASRDAIGGEALMCDYADFADGIMAYLTNAELRERHGNAARKKIMAEYRWVDVAKTLVNACKEVLGAKKGEDAIAVATPALKPVPDTTAKSIHATCETSAHDTTTHPTTRQTTHQTTHPTTHQTTHPTTNSAVATGDRKHEELAKLRARLEELMGNT